MTEDRFTTNGCRLPEAAIHDLHDGVLDAAGRRRVETHLAACDGCRAIYAELDELRRATGALPRAIEPPRDLWPDVEARLEPRSAAVFAGRFPRWLGQLAAAVALILFGAVLSRVLLPPAAVPPGSTSASVESVPDARPAQPAAAIDRTLAVAEYQRARAALEETIARRRDQLEPTTLAVVERNLRIIDQAILELERALATDPENPRLSTLLLASYQQEIDLLQRLATSS